MGQLLCNRELGLSEARLWREASPSLDSDCILSEFIDYRLRENGLTTMKKWKGSSCSMSFSRPPFGSWTHTHRQIKHWAERTNESKWDSNLPQAREVEPMDVLAPLQFWGLMVEFWGYIGGLGGAQCKSFSFICFSHLWKTFGKSFLFQTGRRFWCNTNLLRRGEASDWPGVWLQVMSPKLLSHFYWNSTNGKKREVSIQE